MRFSLRWTRRLIKASLLVVLGVGLANCSSDLDLTPPDDPTQETYRRLVFVGPGGKVTLARLYQWTPLSGAIGKWDQLFLDHQIPPGARVETVDMATLGSPAAVGARSSSAAANAAGSLFMGGTESNSVLATRIAALIDPRSDQPGVTPLQMVQPRYGHSTSRLTDGRVLVTGGYGPGIPTPVHRSAEIFTPATRQFTATGNMVVARANHAVARVSDGRVLVTGGLVPAASGQGTIDASSTEIFTPATGTFAAGSAMTVARYNHSAITLDDGRVLVLGGNRLRSAEIYNPATGTFSAIPDMNAVHGLGHRALKLSDGRVLVLGGDGGTIQPTAVAEIFSPSTNRFTAIASMTSSRMHHWAVLLDDGRVLIGGGQDASGNILASVELFDPASNSFRADAPMPITGTEQGAAFASVTPQE
jgi:hypothetical protein